MRTKFTIAVAILLGCCAGTAWSQENADPALTAAPAAPAGPFQGEITADNVYIRSGAGVHWYPTAKAQRGTVVRVIGPADAPGWLKIVPPEGSFSLVEASAIERAPGAPTGVTKVDQVYVKAGSALSDRKSASQQILPRGVEVTILGERDGFLKVAPPEGSYLYVSDRYVRRYGEGPPLAAAPSEPQAAPSVAESAPPPKPVESTPPPVNPSSGRPKKDPFAALPVPKPDLSFAGQTIEMNGAATPSAATSDNGASVSIGGASRHRAMLESLEGELRNQLAATTGKVDYAPLIDRYRPLADQGEDKVAQAVAKLRIEQLSARMELERIVTDARAQNDSAEQFRTRLGDDRSRIGDVHLPPELRPWDIKGEMLRSAAFNNTRPYRFRIFDPVAQKTVAYVDVPPATGIDPLRFLNQYVGIRVSSQYFSTAAKTTIATVSEIAVLPAPGGVARRDMPPPIEPAIDSAKVPTASGDRPIQPTPSQASRPDPNLPPPILPARGGDATTNIPPPPIVVPEGPAANPRPVSSVGSGEVEQIVAEPLGSD